MMSSDKAVAQGPNGRPLQICNEYQQETMTKGSSTADNSEATDCGAEKNARRLDESLAARRSSEGMWMTVDAKHLICSGHEPPPMIRMDHAAGALQP